MLKKGSNSSLKYETILDVLKNGTEHGNRYWVSYKLTKFYTVITILLGVLSLLGLSCKKNQNENTHTLQHPSQTSNSNYTILNSPQFQRFTGYMLPQRINLDPMLANETQSINFVRNLFVALTEYDFETGQSKPQAATNWEVSDDGLTYIFHLRSDIPWVQYNSSADKFVQINDEKGFPRTVTAHDFSLAIQRGCQSNLNINSTYKLDIAPIIRGCQSQPNLATELGVQAVDDFTLKIDLESPTGHFIILTSSCFFCAIPSWQVGGTGIWDLPDSVPTNGAFGIKEWHNGEQYVLERNNLLPPQLDGGGNIHQMHFSVVLDEDEGYEQWVKGEVDLAFVPQEKVDQHLHDFANNSNKKFNIPWQTMIYLNFSNTSIFQNKQVRQALALSLDKDALSKAVELRINAQPIQFSAPISPFSLPTPTIFTPDQASTLLTEAGFPDCQGLPALSITTSDYQLNDLLDEIALQWTKNLNCSSEQINVMYAHDLAHNSIDDLQNEEGLVWIAKWGFNYPNVNDFLYIYCATIKNQGCDDAKALILDAYVETDEKLRVEKYETIYQILFGKNGDFPVIPMFITYRYVANQPWLAYSPTPFGGEQWKSWQTYPNLIIDTVPP